MDNDTHQPLPVPQTPPNEELEGPYWTLGRIVYILIILITLIAFLVYVLSPTITAMITPPPPPTLEGPLQRA